MVHRTILAASVALIVACRARAGAACPEPTDLAPGQLANAGSTWNVQGDGRTSIADAVAATVIASRGAAVVPPGGCGAGADPAPGLADPLSGTFAPVGDGAWTDCDAGALADVILGRTTLTSDASDYPGSSAATAAALVALDPDPGLADAAFLEGLATALEAADAQPRGAAAFHAWTQIEVLGDCYDLPAPGTALPSAPPPPPTLLQRIEATLAWQVLKELVSTVTFAFVPEPIAITVQAADPAMFVAFSYAAVRKNIASASITIEQRLELEALCAQNPYEAQRRLLQMTGQPIPDWLQAAPPSCLRRCAPETCANAFDDDGDGDADCADSDCGGQPACIETDCDDGADDDHDGFTDCADADCSSKPACIETNCANGLDDDHDGLTDCDDPQCELGPACVESACTNGADDDGDGATDCDDADCAGTTACAETACGDGTDDDGDGFTDCDDADCQLAGECQGERWCGCWFDSTSPNVNDWVWRCHEQSDASFSPPYDALVSPGACQCGPEIFTVCE